MKNFFSAFNGVVGILFLLLGVRIFHSLSLGAVNAVAALVALSLGGACLWLASQTASERSD
jgi:hypothetical protein